MQIVPMAFTATEPRPALTGVCSAGSQPCPNEPLCDEANDRCFECVVDADCDDGVNCNGEETCSANVCVAGSSTCSNDNVCDEANDQCVECLVNGDCSEGDECLDTMCIPLLGEWTWVSGAKTDDQSGTYGTKGVPDAANVPGARMKAFPGQTATVISGCSGGTATAALQAVPT